MRNGIPARPCAQSALPCAPAARADRFEGLSQAVSVGVARSTAMQSCHVCMAACCVLCRRARCKINLICFLCARPAHVHLLCMGGGCYVGALVKALCVVRKVHYEMYLTLGSNVISSTDQNDSPM